MNRAKRHAPFRTDCDGIIQTEEPDCETGSASRNAAQGRAVDAMPTVLAVHQRASLVRGRTRSDHRLSARLLSRAAGVGLRSHGAVPAAGGPGGARVRPLADVHREGLRDRREGSVPIASGAGADIGRPGGTPSRATGDV